MWQDGWAAASSWGSEARRSEEADCVYQNCSFQALKANASKKQPPSRVNTNGMDERQPRRFYTPDTASEIEICMLSEKVLALGLERNNSDKWLS